VRARFEPPSASLSRPVAPDLYPVTYSPAWLQRAEGCGLQGDGGKLHLGEGCVLESS